MTTLRDQLSELSHNNLLDLLEQSAYALDMIAGSIRDRAAIDDYPHSFPAAQEARRKIADAAGSEFPDTIAVHYVDGPLAGKIEFKAAPGAPVGEKYVRISNHGDVDVRYESVEPVTGQERRLEMHMAPHPRPVRKNVPQNCEPEVTA